MTKYFTGKQEIVQKWHTWEVNISITLHTIEFTVSESDLSQETKLYWESNTKKKIITTIIICRVPQYDLELSKYSNSGRMQDS